MPDQPEKTPADRIRENPPLKVSLFFPPATCALTLIWVLATQDVSGEQISVGIVWTIVVTVVGVPTLVVYLLPAILAYRNSSRFAAPIFFVNLFFGWTLLVWIVCLFLAFSEKTAGSD